MRRLAILAVALGIVGCGGEPTKPADDALAALQTRLPGRYDNAAQVRSDTRAGVAEAQPPIDLLIVNANAALIGKTTYYVRQTPSGNPRRVLSQYIWVFGRTVETRAMRDDKDEHGKPKEYLEQHVYVFKEPQRWLRAGEQPEMLESLLPDDLQRLTGCELLWTRNDTGFTAERRTVNCEPESKSEGQLIEQKIELRDSHLSLLEQQISPDGLLAAPAGQSDPYYRFVRHGVSN